MKIIDKAMGWIGQKILGATYRDKTGWFVEWALGGRRTASGETVSENTALQLGTVFACIRNISEDVAKIPFKLYRSIEPRGKEPLPNHAVYRMLHDMPNPEMTALTFRQTLTAHCLSWGNGYAEIQRDARGKAVALWPLRPDRVVPFRNDSDSQIWYEISTDSGEKYYLRWDNMLHIPGLGFDGLVGYNVIRYGRECIGGALAAQKFASAFYGNNAAPGGILQHPNNLTKEAQTRLRESIQSQLGGAENASRLLVIEEGMTFSQLTIPPEEAQFLETRQFNVAEICRWFRMPPGKVGDTTRAQGWSTLEMTNTDYVTDTLLPWLVRWEMEVWRKLLSPRDKLGGYFAKHVVNGLLRGDVKSRTDAYVKGRNWGWLSADDVRELEDLNPLPDGQGEKYLIPLNMKDAAADDEPTGPFLPPDNSQAKLAQLEADHKADIAGLKSEHEAEVGRLKAELEAKRLAETAQLQADHKEELDQLKAKHETENALYEAEKEQLLAKHQEELEALEVKYGEERARLEAEAEQLKESHQTKLDELTAEHDAVVEKLKAEHEANVEAVATDLQKELGQAKKEAKVWKERRQKLNSRLIDAAAEKIARAEIDGLSKRLLKAPADIDKWQQFVRGWFSKHGSFIERVLGEFTDKNEGPAKTLVADGVLAFTGDDPAKTMEKWKVERSSHIVDILREELGC